MRQVTADKSGLLLTSVSRRQLHSVGCSFPRYVRHSTYIKSCFEWNCFHADFQLDLFITNAASAGSLAYW